MKLQKDLGEVEITKMIETKDIVFVIISIVGLIALNVQLFQIFKVMEGIYYRFIVFDVIGSLIILLMDIYGILSKREIILNRIKIETLKEMNTNLLDVDDQVRCFKHDFNNIIQSIDGYITLDDMISLQLYFNSLVKDCNHINKIDFLNQKMLDNPAICSVLLSKYKLAEEKDIRMNIDILVDLQKFKDKSYVISRMLGILLDNALEASNECEEKIVNVQFLKDKNKDLIIVENTYIDTGIDTDKIFEKNFTTKKHKGNSGLGLWKVHDILKKDTNLDLFTTKDEVMFRQRLEIYG